MNGGGEADGVGRWRDKGRHKVGESERGRERKEARKWKKRNVWERRLTGGELLGPFRKAHRTSVSCRATAMEERTSEVAENGMKKEWGSWGGRGLGLKFRKGKQGKKLEWWSMSGQNMRAERVQGTEEHVYHGGNVIMELWGQRANY